MEHLFLPFKTDIKEISIPEKFTYPFNYIPHTLSEVAAKELQEYIKTQTEWFHNFGIDKQDSKNAVGKMFGVLICKNSKGRLGQLWAFSGKLAEGNQWSNFVPTVFDMLTQEGFYKKGEAILNNYNRKIARIEKSKEFVKLLGELKQEELASKKTISNQKERIKVLKKERSQKREEALLLNLSEEQMQTLLRELNEESKKENIILKKIKKHNETSLDFLKQKVAIFSNEIKILKETRKKKSAQLQEQLFKEYAFLNIKQETKSLGAIFDVIPPAGAGECCAPKLLHYAFKNRLKPVAMAEFWWGKSPNSEIRKHQNFYPSCRSKCEPILLNHMLQGLEVDNNPLEEANTSDKDLEIIYEDQWISIINKPSGLLSVPGKRIKDSVYSRVKERYPLASGPLVVHRLDRATSGLLIIAKDLESYITLQRQFTNRTVKKRYKAFLEGEITNPKGEINLPLRVDLDNRPQQLVCYEYGKNALTHYEVIEVKNGITKIYFYPVTGRTHQLRVHSAHVKGLNAPIIGDDLYGKSTTRLELYAEWIQFRHPNTGEAVTFKL